MLAEPLFSLRQMRGGAAMVIAPPPRALRPVEKHVNCRLDRAAKKTTGASPLIEDVSDRLRMTSHLLLSLEDAHEREAAQKLQRQQALCRRSSLR